MATYSGANYTNNVPLPGAVGDGGMVKIMTSGLVTVSSALTGADVGTLLIPPKGFTVVDTIVESTDMDTNGSPTATLNVGISGTAQLLVAASTVMQAGTAASTVTTAGLGYQFNGTTAVVWAIGAGPATGATGTFQIWIRGYYTATVA